ncbi:hypothetical protein U1Q18_034613 [Sarracenia purpurea var. burkii]
MISSSVLPHEKRKAERLEKRTTSTENPLGNVMRPLTLARHHLTSEGFWGSNFFDSLFRASYLVEDVNEFESAMDAPKLLAAREEIDLVDEYFGQICQNAISKAAKKLTLKAYDLLSMDGLDVLSRGLLNGNVSKFCPLGFSQHE